MVLFNALALMLLTKFIPNRKIRTYSSGINPFDYNAKLTLNRYDINLSQIAPKSKFPSPLQKIDANNVP